MADKQLTLKYAIKLSGVGLHTGKKTNINITPAPVNHGFKFQRVDVEGEPIINADVSLVSDTQRGTTLEKDGVKVHTTEHVLAALYGSGVDNALIQIDGPEIPIMDGSAWPFVDAIQKAGIEEQEADREYFEFEENIKFEIEEKGIEILAVPDDNYRVTVMVDYNSPVLGTQHASMLNIKSFNDEIAKSRTFVFLRELEYLAKNNLIKGGDIDNAIVLVDRPEVSQDEIDNLRKLLGKENLDVKIDGMGVLNNTKLHYENEPARHKLLDIVGDLALAGVRIKGHILSARPGHHGNTEFAKIIKDLADKKKKSKIKKFDISTTVYDVNQIAGIIPHRYPFLLIDRITEVLDEGIIGIKNVTLNEPYFTGHFPGNPVMPGVLQIEAMAQCGGVFALHEKEDPENYSTYFLKIDNVKYKRKVIPGDTLVFELKLLRPIRRGLVNMKGKAYVNGELASEAEMLAQVVKENHN